MNNSLPPGPNFPQGNELGDTPVPGVPPTSPVETPQQSGDNFSLDEIMKALREKEREKDEKGEVVTRSDGSVARRVRRRKRRSEQQNEGKKKEEYKKKSVVIKAAIGVGSFLFLLMGALFIFVAFNSDSYEEKLELHSGEWVGGEVDILQHKVLPGRMTFDSVNFNWPENSHLVDLQIKAVEGDVRFISLLGARMGGQAIGGKTGTLRVRSPELAGDLITINQPGDFPFEYNRYYCDGLNVNFGTSGQLDLFDLETSMRYFPGEGFRVTMSAGMLSLKGWQKFPIDNGLLKFPQGEVKVETLRLRNPLEERSGSSDSLVLSGVIPTAQGQKAQLDITTSAFPFEVIMGDEMGSFFSGSMRVDSSGLARYTTGNDFLDEVILKFDGDQMTLHRFPLVDNIKKLIFNNIDQELLFDGDVKGVYRWTPRGVALENLVMSNKRLRVEGNMVIGSNDRIRGQLTMWISMGYINGNPRLENHPAFKRRSDDRGYAIIEIELGGTTTLPSDSFLMTTGLNASHSRSGVTPVKSAAELLRELEEGAE